MFPKGTVSAAGAPTEKPPVTAQKESTVVYMVDNTESQVDAVNESYWRTQRARICACAVVLTTLILVAGTLGGIFIILTHTKGVVTIDPTPSVNQDHEPLISNEVPLPKLPESTIRIKIDDGGLVPPTEPTTPDLIAIDDVTDYVTDEVLPSSSIDYDSSSQPPSVASYNRLGKNYISSSYPHDSWYANGQESIPPSDRSDWIGPSEREREEAEEEVSGDDQGETVYGSGEEPDSPSADTSVRFPDSSSDAYHWRSRASDGIVASSWWDRNEYDSSEYELYSL
ncbi:uncharacterized protein LOC117299064 [Asterias rubens]|uniref:uncharacterized protein LOC117299064 n=1 Tax=Asterias rubens TaxID=7604 RepID=UPI0014555D17|nr:uncharacterized protein LOC117299064 [Asterias rubens]